MDGTSSVSGAHCITKTCPEKDILTLYTPPPVIYAGTWKASKANISFETGVDKVARLDFDTAGSSFTLDFAPPDYHAGGDNVMDQHGKVTGAYSGIGADIKVSGDFRLENHCTIQERTRACGQPVAGDGMTNPIKRPYTENTCPSELVAPFEASPTWKGHTLHLGSISIDCRVTNSSHTDNETDKVLCYRRATMKANGCDWDVHFETDGNLQWFAVAAFASSGCGSQPTCNTYR